MPVSPRISLFTNARLTTHLFIHRYPSHRASLYSPIPVSPRVSLYSTMPVSPRVSLFTNVRLTTHLFIHQCPSHHVSLYSPMPVAPCISLFTNVRLTTRLFIHQSSLVVEGVLESLSSIVHTDYWTDLIVERQDPNTQKIQRNAVYSDKTQHANFRGSPVYRATKRHLNNS